MHTPGPWNIGSSDLPVSTISVHSNTGSKHSTLARVVDASYMSAVESYDNARLMAAAPELVDCVSDLIDAIETAIRAGDWKVDGACDPTEVVIRAKAIKSKAML